MLKEHALYNTCNCDNPLETVYTRKHPYPESGWKFCNIYYLRCTVCDALFIGEYAEGRVGSCFSRSPIERIHQLEWGDKAYWAYHVEEVAI